ncbi:glycosyltransferase family 20 protein [Clostridium chauvoei]|uniref:glycosyltransferase family 20 protein n=1 Tax=Clostridium chauvoei TaxID=46867 RepID=UPI001FA828A2|nr:glycosyltransferase family 20 protein [Clostridium chauvoei]
MSEIFTLSLMTAILCGGWVLGCDLTGLIGFQDLQDAQHFLQQEEKKKVLKLLFLLI